MLFFACCFAGVVVGWKSSDNPKTFVSNYGEFIRGLNKSLRFALAADAWALRPSDIKPESSGKQSTDYWYCPPLEYCPPPGGPLVPKPDPIVWLSLFNGMNLDGWKASENTGTFTVKDFELIAHGARSHLFYTGPVNGANFTNFEFEADIMTKPGANSGIYLHTELQETGWPEKGYEIQVNNTHKDPKKTAGVYGIRDNFTAPVKDGEWFTLRIKVTGKRIETFVNDKPIADYTEEPNPTRTKRLAGRLLSHGTFALQGHDPASEVHYKHIFVKPLP
ncbi:MAG: DUF1080 domain-containing protein [Verrucomicrobia bacterium]|nr:DUF1080 domain-containing protein [Verrucomicrobiota bacterium]